MVSQVHAFDPLLIFSGNVPAAGGCASWTQQEDNTGTGNDSDTITYPYYGVIQATGTYDMVRARMAVCRDGATTGSMYMAIYTAPTTGADGLPDDRVGLSDVVDVSTIYNIAGVDANCESNMTEFTFSTPVSITDTEYYMTVVYYTSQTGEIIIRNLTSGGLGKGTRSGGAAGATPGATDDVANWAEVDVNATVYVQMDSCAD